MPALHALAHHVFPATRFVMDIGPVQANDVSQEPLGEAVLAHHLGGAFPAHLGQFQVTVVGNNHQAIALHAADGLRNSGAGVPQPLGDAGAESHNVLFFKLQNGPKIHLSGIDQIRHPAQPPRAQFLA